MVGMPYRTYVLVADEAPVRATHARGAANEGRALATSTRDGDERAVPRRRHHRCDFAVVAVGRGQYQDRLGEGQGSSGRGRGGRGGCGGCSIGPGSSGRRRDLWEAFLGDRGRDGGLQVRPEHLAQSRERPRRFAENLLGRRCMHTEKAVGRADRDTAAALGRARIDQEHVYEPVWGNIAYTTFANRKNVK